MPSFCPHCGAEAPEEARFCMRCGRERTAAAPPPPPPPNPPAAQGTPPPPAYAPGPAQPSAVGQFLGRALRGDWAGAAQAALWPVGLLLVAAFALAVPSYGQDPDDVVIGFADRMRVALAVLLQGLGGSLEVSGGSGGSVYGGGYDSGSSGSASLSVIPLLVTVVWIVALVMGVRMLRTRLYARTVPGAPGGASAGLEAAVRVALLVTGATLVLALIGQPDIEEVSLHTGPFLTALWTLLLSLAVAGGVLYGDDLKYRIAAARPGVRMPVRAFGTAVRAMGWVLLIAAVLGWAGLAIFGDDGASNPSDVAESSDFDGSDAAALGVFLVLLPNLALAVLGLCFGAPLQFEGRGSSSLGGGGYEKESFGLSRLGDELGSGAVVYALAIALICALVVGVLTARRSLDRREQFLSAGLFFGLLLLLAGVGGIGAEFAGDLDFFGSGSGRVDLGVSVADLLLFGLLWIGAAAFLAPYLMRMAGVATGLVPPPLPALPGMAPLPAMPDQSPTTGQTPPSTNPPAAPHTAPSANPPAAPHTDPHTAPSANLPTAPSTGPVANASAAPSVSPAANQPAAPSADSAANQPAAPSANSAANPPATLDAAPTADQTPLPAVAGQVPPPGAPPQLPASGKPGHTPPARVNPELPPVPYTPTVVPVGHVPGPYQLTPPAAQALGGERSSRRVGVWVGTVVGAIVIGGGAAAGVLLLMDDGGDHKQDGKGGEPVATQSRSQSQTQPEPASPTPTPTPTEAETGTSPDPTPSVLVSDTAPTDMPEVPAGYHEVFDEKGFSFAVPEAWDRVGVQNGSQVTYAGSTGMEKYVVGVIPFADYTSHGNLLAMEKHLKEDEKKTNYRRILLDTNTFQGEAGAIWEYTYENEAGQTIHGIDQSYIAADGTEYTIFLTGKEDLWNDLVGTYQVGLDSWRLTDID
ncbi:zinc-ribbon domain-containing protein [Streptomyces sp. NPDC016845]|uniref:zinc ribbon domain-containing protein n=1 Tax=Streptomyces sp. NPDC016845 TaxID=3364972 RepID=UPI0037B36D7C